MSKEGANALNQLAATCSFARFGDAKMHSLRFWIVGVMMSTTACPLLANPTPSCSQSINATGSDGAPLIGATAPLASMSPPSVVKQIALAKEINVKLIRWEAPWKDVERQRGVLNVPKSWDDNVALMEKNGISSFLVLDYGNQFYDSGFRPTSKEAVEAYTDYAKFVINHFKGRIKYFEIWNEWDQNNGNSGIGTSDEYERLVKFAMPILKKVDPEAKIIIGGASRDGIESFNSERNAGRSAFLKDIIDDGVIKYADGLSIHPYVREGNETSTKISSLDRIVSNINIGLKNASMEGFPIYITEIGWPTAPGQRNSVSDSDQKDLIEGAIKNLRKISNIKSIIFFELSDTSSGKYGLFDRAGFAKIATKDFNYCE